MAFRAAISSEKLGDFGWDGLCRTIPIRITQGLGNCDRISDGRLDDWKKAAYPPGSLCFH